MTTVCDSPPVQQANWARIPLELQGRRQWALAGADKRPVTVDGRPASSTEPRTWTDFGTVCQVAAARGLHIGYMLHETDPFTCIDLDVKSNTPPEHIKRFDRVASAFDSYTERSRSGLGLHIWVEGKIGRGRKRDGVEVYSQERFIICTGNTHIDKPIAKRQELLETLVGEMGLEPAIDFQLSDDDPNFALAARACEDTGELGRLFAGHWDGRYPSQSEADLALVKLLMPHTDSMGECWSTFRLSKLGQRDKARRRDYAQSTLAMAAQHLVNDAAQIQHGRQLAKSLSWQAPAHNPRHYRLLSDQDLQHLPPHQWLVKGIIPETGIGTIFGQSGTFKSFIALDLMAYVANGQPWFGRRVRPAPAVYVPFEGQGGLPKRVAAWRLALLHRGYDVTTNMRFITDPMNLRQQADRDKLVTTLTEAGWAGGILCIDTLAQAGPGIDENTSQGMGEMIAIFQELQKRLGGVVLVVHHSGKTEKAGMRGWSGLLGALDFAIRCWRDDDWNWFDGQFVLDKVKDGESGLWFDFSMVRVTIGHDEDSEPITSLTVSPPTEVQKETVPDDGQIAAADDAFVEMWVRKEMAEGRYPTGRSLESQRPIMKAQRALTQKRLRDAIDRLKAGARLTEETNGPSGNKWLRAIDLPHRGAA